MSWLFKKKPKKQELQIPSNFLSSEDEDEEEEEESKDQSIKQQKNSSSKPLVQKKEESSQSKASSLSELKSKIKSYQSSAVDKNSKSKVQSSPNLDPGDSINSSAVSQQKSQSGIDGNKGSNSNNSNRSQQEILFFKAFVEKLFKPTQELTGIDVKEIMEIFKNEIQGQRAVLIRQLYFNEVNYRMAMIKRNLVTQRLIAKQKEKIQQEKGEVNEAMRVSLEEEAKRKDKIKLEEDEYEKAIIESKKHQEQYLIRLEEEERELRRAVFLSLQQMKMQGVEELESDRLARYAQQKEFETERERTKMEIRRLDLEKQRLDKEKEMKLQMLQSEREKQSIEEREIARQNEERMLAIIKERKRQKELEEEERALKDLNDRKAQKLLEKRQEIERLKAEKQSKILELQEVEKSVEDEEKTRQARIAEMKRQAHLTYEQAKEEVERANLKKAEQERIAAEIQAVADREVEVLKSVLEMQKQEISKQRNSLVIESQLIREQKEKLDMQKEIQISAARELQRQQELLRAQELREEELRKSMLIAQKERILQEEQEARAARERENERIILGNIPRNNGTYSFQNNQKGNRSQVINSSSVSEMDDFGMQGNARQQEVQREKKEDDLDELLMISDEDDDDEDDDNHDVKAVLSLPVDRNDNKNKQLSNEMGNVKNQNTTSQKVYRKEDIPDGYFGNLIGGSDELNNAVSHRSGVNVASSTKPRLEQLGNEDIDDFNDVFEQIKRVDLPQNKFSGAQPIRGPLISEVGEKRVTTTTVVQGNSMSSSTNLQQNHKMNSYLNKQSESGKNQQEPVVSRAVFIKSQSMESSGNIRSKSRGFSRDQKQKIKFSEVGKATIEKRI